MEFRAMHATSRQGIQAGPTTTVAAATVSAPSRPGESVDETAWGRSLADTALDTISEMPERTMPVNNSPTSRSESDRSPISPSRPSPRRVDGVDKCQVESGTAVSRSAESPPLTASPSPSRVPAVSPVIPLRPPRPSTLNKIADNEQEDSLSADEGIQTSPPFERDEPWELAVAGLLGSDEVASMTAAQTPRRYSMSALQRPPRRLQAEPEGAEEEASAPGRSPVKTRLAEEIKARRWRYRPKSCSLPHLDWLKQRTESTLDRSAEMQRRTAELIQNAKIARELDV